MYAIPFQLVFFVSSDFLDDMTSGFHIFTGNRLEVLAGRLADVLRSVPAGAQYHPLQPQTVMVQSKGMQRWLSMTVARFNGICTNIDFPFPNALLERLYTQIIGNLPEYYPYEPHVLTFRILYLLPDLLELPEFEPLRRYLSNQHRPLKLYQLARKIAAAFDQYAVYRSDLLVGWERNQAILPNSPNAAWQAVLWRELARHTPTPHRAVLQKRLVRKLTDLSTSIARERLPAGLSVFGISHLPPFHLEVLEALACRIPVYLFLLNPCRHYWFDILSDHQMVRMRASQPQQSPPLEQLHLDRGNRLLASLGHLGKDFFDRIYQFQANLTDEFIDNRVDSLLGRIQQDILDLVDRPQSAGQIETTPAKADGSLRIHSCHSPMREVEVLHDQLLDLLEGDPDLQPRDILVMTPDIAMYSPYIHAVFGAGENSRINLPFSVADQNISQDRDVIECFIRLLDLVDRRFEASRVMMLLECGTVCRQFGLTEADLPILERWIRQAGIRWGWDAAERRRHDLPGSQENSWRYGLDRLVLGYAMAADDMQLFSGVLPYDSIGAGETRILGGLVAFAETLHEVLEKLAVADSLKGWKRRLMDVLNRLFRVDEQIQYELQILHGVIEQLQRVGVDNDDGRTIAFEVIRQHIKDVLMALSYDSGFMSGGITFCAMLPMRSIPAQVICLLGMNHDAYPREEHDPRFNLITEEPRFGDRSRRNDDRYLFLETLISARKAFYISYVGQNIQDNSPIPPSVLVDEMVEYVSEGLGISADQFVVSHLLQSFSPSYFNGENPLLFSYSLENKAAAERLMTPKSEPLLFAEPLSAPPESWKKCEWGQLASFFAHPARYLLEHRLGVFLHEDPETIEDRESFVLEPLGRYKIGQRILEGVLGGASPDQIYPALSASGILPHGTVGKVLYQELSAEVRIFMNTMAALLPEEMPRSEPLELDLNPYFLYGNIDQLYGHARIVWRMAKARPADLLKTFLFHLALLATPATGLPKTSIFICKEAVWHFEQVEKPDRVLREYLDLFWLGVQKPLLLLNRTSFEFAQRFIVNQQSRKEALAAAVNKWCGNEFVPGEAQDAYHLRCIGAINPFTAEFEEIALKVYRPLFAASRCMACEE
ncbi:MAG: exodeoxyribonuclease V subunit gamma [Desulfobacteraceae bacterium]|nr:MAG: exodeoxyribonuclease V subunit gamma [Desulfobacteraceae bacterium]